MKMAFNRGPRRIIWKIFSGRKINEKMKRIRWKAYIGNWNCVISENRTSESLITVRGLREGGALSLILFIVFMDERVKKCKMNSIKYSVGYWYLKSLNNSFSYNILKNNLCAFRDKQIHTETNIIFFRIIYWRKIL